MERSWSTALVLAGAALAAAFTAAPTPGQTPFRAGVELQVNSYTSGAQSAPSVAMDDDGEFVVVWGSVQDGYGNGVFARRFGSGGNPLGIEFQVNSSTSGDETGASVAVDADGDFVVAWRVFGQDGSAFGVFAQRFDSGGAAAGVEFQVNLHTGSHQWYPAAGMDDAGRFVIVWSSYAQDGSSYGIFGRRFDSTGAGQGGEFQINEETIASQRKPAVAVNADGDFVVAWESFGQDGSASGVFARRFDAAGAPQASEFQVNTYTTGYQTDPVVAMNADGAFVVVWESPFQDGFSLGLFARSFDAAGTGLGAEFQVSLATLLSQYEAATQMQADGSFVIVWQAPDGGYGGGYGISGRRFDAGGAAQGGEFRVNSYTLSNQAYPSLGMTDEGDFVVAWRSTDQDGSSHGIFAQRFGPSAALDVDGSGAVAALTDGLLVLRYLFGLTGAALTSSAVDLGACTRCDGDAVGAYVASLGSVADVDGNGALGALTDGLLVVRFLFGLTGDSLVAGVVDLQGCTRCDATAIATYLATLI